MNKQDVTVIICCAGMGTRLGIGTTKALVNVCGKPLIIRQLELLEDYDDVRIVVGYQAEKVIEIVNNFRKDIMFAFNHDFKNTGVADSLTKGLIGTKKYVVTLDGDLLIDPEDFKKFMSYDGECVGASMPNSEEPVYINTDSQNNAVGFSREKGELEWTGLSKVRSDKFQTNKQYIYEMIENVLPLHYISIDVRDIDTPEDYENAVKWYSNKVC